MPAWLLTALEEIGPITTVAESIEKLGLHIVNALKGGESVASVAQAIGAAAGDIHNAIHANTRVGPQTAEEAAATQADPGQSAA